MEVYKELAMPEYAQIQTSFTGERPKLAAIIHSYESFLTQINFDTHKIKAWIVQMKSLLETGEKFGDIYKEVVPIVIDNKKTINCIGLSLLLEKSAYTFGSNVCMLSLELLFNTEDIRDVSTSFYKIGVGEAIWRIFTSLHAVFPETKIYFTDEWQNSQLKDIPDERNGDIWAFDAALIPQVFMPDFSPIPFSMKCYMTKSIVGFARNDRWKILPWTEYKERAWR